jgi:hypothetical protein
VHTAESRVQTGCSLLQPIFLVHQILDASEITTRLVPAKTRSLQLCEWPSQNVCVLDFGSLLRELGGLMYI